MLGRRHLRIRVLQALYTWFQSEGANRAVLEQEMFKGTTRFYDLYISLLSLFIELKHRENLYLEDVTPKFVSKKIKFYRTLGGLKFIQWLSSDKKFESLAAKHKISWQQESDLVEKCFYRIRNSALYISFTQSETAPQSESDFLAQLFKKEIQGSELLQEGLEDKNIWWAEGLDYANAMITRTLKSEKQQNGEITFEISPLFRDEEDDIEFMKTLFNHAANHDDELKTLVAGRTQNWDVERIAMMDIILMKMALAEILYMPNVPVKVSINEYIDISKEYSTPSSKIFINGVLDKIVADLKRDNRIIKSGRGLIEN